MNPAGLDIRGLRIVLDGRAVIEDLNLRLEPGELLVLAGPSGSGKSSLLRAIAGLLPVAAGEIGMDGRLLNPLAPGRRNLAMMFQSHALMPHMSVADNLGFGLRARGMKAGEARRKATDMAALLGIEALLARMPAQLSGGEAQRVALGRALLREAGLLLMDEPLSSLDAPLRESLRREILAQHRRLGTSCIYVTHDQSEALAMADRVAVLDQGRLRQCAPPRELHDRPIDTFVARFFGEPPMNLLALEHGQERDAVWAGQPLALNLPAEQAVLLGVRPEQIQLAGSRWARGAPPTQTWRGRLIESAHVGDQLWLRLDCAGQSLQARVEPDFQLREEVEFWFQAEGLCLFDAETGRALA